METAQDRLHVMEDYGLPLNVKVSQRIDYTVWTDTRGLKSGSEREKNGD